MSATQGLYIHIPFCKQACHYCDFHFSVNTASADEMVRMICKELLLRKEYLPSGEFTSVYFGGGTPSLLNGKQLGLIFETLHRNFTIAPDAEITLEANPDDLDKRSLEKIKAASINRLSIGIQSFDDRHLTFLNRAHQSRQALDCVHEAQDLGLDRISIDLIYGIPFTDHSIWEKDLEIACSLGVGHISSYCLTIEKNTAFGRWVQKGTMPLPEEEFAAQQFEKLMEVMEQNGFEQYEISNFCLPGQMAVHNSQYWKNVPYLGVGPSAHSYDLESRQYNIANNQLYLQELNKGHVPFEKEVLNEKDKVNEYILTRLRTIWGIQKDFMQEKLLKDFSLVEKKLDEYIQSGHILFEKDTYKLTKKGKLLADKITGDIFLA